MSARAQKYAYGRDAMLMCTYANGLTWENFIKTTYVMKCMHFRFVNAYFAVMLGIFAHVFLKKESIRRIYIYIRSTTLTVQKIIHLFTSFFSFSLSCLGNTVRRMNKRPIFFHSFNCHRIGHV